MLSETRDMAAAQKFFRSARAVTGVSAVPPSAIVPASQPPPVIQRLRPHRVAKAPEDPTVLVSAREVNGLVVAE